jgi:hypothetical protein
MKFDKGESNLLSDNKALANLDSSLTAFLTAKNTTTVQLPACDPHGQFLFRHSIRTFPIPSPALGIPVSPSLHSCYAPESHPFMYYLVEPSALVAAARFDFRH